MSAHQGASVPQDDPVRSSRVSNCLLLHHSPFEVGDLTCKDTKTGPVIPNPRAVAVWGQLLTMAAIGSLLSVRVRYKTETQFWSSRSGQECSDPRVGAALAIGLRESQASVFTSHADWKTRSQTKRK
jgi:hypothetical protein